MVCVLLSPASDSRHIACCLQPTVVRHTIRNGFVMWPGDCGVGFSLRALFIERCSSVSPDSRLLCGKLPPEVNVIRMLEKEGGMSHTLAALPCREWSLFWKPWSFLMS